MRRWSIALASVLVALGLCVVGASPVLGASSSTAGTPSPAAGPSKNDGHARARGIASANHRGGKATKAKRHSSGARKVDATFTYELTPPETTLPATQTITLLIPKGIQDAGAQLPSCNPEKLQNFGERVCPKGSLVGTGSAAGYTLGVVEPIKLTLYNGPGGSLLSYVVGLDPVSIQIVVVGTVTRPAGSTYGQQIAFTIPQGLLEPLPEDPAWVLSLSTHLIGRAGWLRSSSCPPHGWAFQAKFGFTNLQTISVGASAACLS